MSVNCFRLLALIGHKVKTENTWLHLNGYSVVLQNTCASQVTCHRSLLRLGVGHVCPIGDTAVLFLVVILIIQRPRDRCALKLRCLNYYDNTLCLSCFSTKSKNSDSCPFKQFAYTVIRAWLSPLGRQRLPCRIIILTSLLRKKWLKKILLWKLLALSGNLLFPSF